uniref:Uncharacterized protein n=1 Tax=Downingia elegans TaxID=104522 RepID=A0A1Z2QTB5_9ASTR|nr:hypothetical protein Do_ele1Pt0309 [Downingia elegans]ASA34670.1 hypothetical protein Do_ele1Pt0309 [Downingia elegans]
MEEIYMAKEFDFNEKHYVVVVLYIMYGSRLNIPWLASLLEIQKERIPIIINDRFPRLKQYDLDSYRSYRIIMGVTESQIRELTMELANKHMILHLSIAADLAGAKWFKAYADQLTLRKMSVRSSFICLMVQQNLALYVRNINPRDSDKLSAHFWNGVWDAFITHKEGQLLAEVEDEVGYKSHWAIKESLLHLFEEARYYSSEPYADPAQALTLLWPSIEPIMTKWHAHYRRETVINTIILNLKDAYLDPKTSREFPFLVQRLLEKTGDQFITECLELDEIPVDEGGKMLPDPPVNEKDYSFLYRDLNYKS